MAKNKDDYKDGYKHIGNLMLINLTKDLLIQSLVTNKYICHIKVLEKILMKDFGYTEDEINKMVDEDFANYNAEIESECRAIDNNHKLIDDFFSEYIENAKKNALEIEAKLKENENGKK